MTEKFILVVEDNPVIRRLVETQLTGLGCLCQSVRTGEEAVERDHTLIKLVFMDIGLPGISGIEAAIRIRERELTENRNRVPIIALTAHLERERCLMAGMDDFLQKPALIADLKRMLTKWAPKSTTEDADFSMTWTEQETATYIDMFSVMPPATPESAAKSPNNDRH